MFFFFGVGTGGDFVTLLGSESGIKFKIETKNDASMNCDFDVTTLVAQSFKNSESECDT